MSPTTRRWIWALGGLVAVLAVTVVVVAVTHDDNSENASTTTTAATSTSVSSVTTTSNPSAPTTETSAPTTTTGGGLPVITDDPQTYAEYLFAAWQHGNRTAAANVASADAISQMFARAYPAQGPYTFSNCGPAAGSLYCTWNGQNGASLQIAVRTLTGGLPIQVENVQFMS